MNSRLLFRWLVVLPLLVRGLGWVLFRLTGLGGGLGGWVRATWPRQPHFVQNLAMGRSIAVAIHVGHGLSLVRETEDFAMDLVNRLQVDTRWLNPAGGQGYALLDLDEASFAAWGEPFHVPRDRLARLIRYAADGGAAVIVLDVALDRPGTDPAADKALAALIEAYPADPPDLVLLRTAKPPPLGQSQPMQWRQTYFDAAELSPRGALCALPLRQGRRRSAPAALVLGGVGLSRG
jgi:hypothetical protein